MALSMINAINVMNKSLLLADVNITLGYWILDSCSDVSTVSESHTRLNPAGQLP